MDFRFENFKTVYEFEKALSKRPINPSFGRRASLSSERTGDSDWYQTEDYSEADTFLKKGWNAKIDELRGELERFSRTVIVKRQRMIKSVIGFIPCIPNAIRGVPKTMYAFEKRDSKETKRILHLVMNNNSTAGTSGETLLKAGITLLKVAMILEKAMVRTKIDVVPFMSYEGSYKCYGCTVTIKEYRQPFNYSKMAYPIANPSWFRRHGFRWLETQSGEMEDWVCGYGSSIHKRSKEQQEKYLKYAGLRDDGVVYIDLDDCIRANFDAERLMADKGISK